MQIEWTEPAAGEEREALLRLDPVEYIQMRDALFDAEGHAAAYRMAEQMEEEWQGR